MEKRSCQTLRIVEQLCNTCICMIAGADVAYQYCTFWAASCVCVEEVSGVLLCTNSTQNMVPLTHMCGLQTCSGSFLCMPMDKFRSGVPKFEGALDFMTGIERLGSFATSTSLFHNSNPTKTILTNQASWYGVTW